MLRAREPDSEASAQPSAFRILRSLLATALEFFFGIAVTYVRSRQSLRAFFKRRGFTAQVRENLAGEME